MIEKVFEIPDSFNELEKEIAKTPIPSKVKVVKEPKKKNNVSEEGRLKMLANLKKGRESRKINLNKAHEQRQQELKSDIDSLKQLVKDALEPKSVEVKPVSEQVQKPSGDQTGIIQNEAKPTEKKPIEVKPIEVKPVSIPLNQIEPVPKPSGDQNGITHREIKQEVAPPYVIKYAFNRPLWS